MLSGIAQLARERLRQSGAAGLLALPGVAEDAGAGSAVAAPSSSTAADGLSLAVRSLPGAAAHLEVGDYFHTPALLRDDLPVPESPASLPGVVGTITNARQEPPLSPSLVKQFLETSLQTPAQRCSLATLSQGLKEQAEVIVTEAAVPAHDRLPKQVRYERACGSLCKQCSPLRMLDHQQQLLKVWKAVIRKFSDKGRVANCPTADLLLAHEVYCEGDAPGPPSCVVFAGIVEGTGSFASEEDHFTFVIYDKIRGSSSPPFADTVLRCRREDFIKGDTPHRSPLDQGYLGSLAFRDEDQLSAQLLAEAGRSVSYIEMHVIKATVQDMFDTVHCDSLVESHKLEAGAPRPAPLPPPPQPPAVQDGEVDFLEELLQCPGLSAPPLLDRGGDAPLHGSQSKYIRTQIDHRRMYIPHALGDAWLRGFQLRLGISSLGLAVVSCLSAAIRISPC